MKRSPREIVLVERLPEGFQRFLIADGSMLEFHTMCREVLPRGVQCLQDIEFKVTISKRSKWGIRRDRELKFVCAKHGVDYINRAQRIEPRPGPLRIVGP